MARTAPGLIVAVVALLGAAPAAAPAAKCKKHACEAASKPAKHKTGWHNGTYDGGPGDPIIAPVPVRAHHCPPARPGGSPR